MDNRKSHDPTQQSGYIVRLFQSNSLSAIICPYFIDFRFSWCVHPEADSLVPNELSCTNSFLNSSRLIFADYSFVV
ncbi:MAG: hypothetical protein V7K14_27180 [Nostoc sp.]|uniref:hypothetical protein n=1 Tax=Nostoc sp. TaxID=1180 RepID=UPI002FF859A5